MILIFLQCVFVRCVSMSLRSLEVHGMNGTGMQCGLDGVNIRGGVGATEKDED